MQDVCRTRGCLLVGASGHPACLLTCALQHPGVGPAAGLEANGNYSPLEGPPLSAPVSPLSVLLFLPHHSDDGGVLGDNYAPFET